MPEVSALVGALERGHIVLTTGLVLQELLQGFAGAKARTQILGRFSALPLLMPDRQDHIDAAELRNRCRRAGIQIGTIDVLLAQLCIHHDLTMLTTDGDFRNIAGRCALKLWRAEA
jgi:predicted nucleic acid-binding protein